jgi:hypothetical protein
LLRTLLVTVMLLFPPNRRIVPFTAVEPTLLLPLITLLVTLPHTIRSDVPPASSLFSTLRSSLGTGTSTEALLCPLNLLLTISALQRPKLVWMPLPEPGPGLLLFWIRLNFTRVGLRQVESNSMPEMLFWTTLFRIWCPPCVPEKPGFVQMPERKHGSLSVEP